VLQEGLREEGEVTATAQLSIPGWPCGWPGIALFLRPVSRWRNSWCGGT